ncbi:MAG: hypothetical protein KCHDKBKB_00091 [Elusimicrobia bacterium]|nr:hypothetical protein [Elusimicrobiota bacterium]
MINWGYVGGASYDAQVSTAANFSSLLQSTTNTTQTYFDFKNLNANTTYYFHVKLATETPTAYVGNTISTITAPAVLVTAINPFFSAVWASSLTVNWNNLGTVYYAELSAYPWFSPLIFGGTTSVNSLMINSLSDNTSHYFRVRVDTETINSFGSNTISTKTVSLKNQTDLSPSVTFVAPDLINVSWKQVPGLFYTAVLATDPGYGTVVSSQTINFSSRTYASLQVCTTHYFQIKVSTESDASFVLNRISTQTLCASGNSALQFNLGGNTQNQRVQVPHRAAYNLQGETTVEFWFRRASISTPTANEYLISKDSYGKSTGWSIYLQGGTGKIRFEPHVILGGLTTTRSILNMDWHHFAVVKSSVGVTTLYLDGTLEASAFTNTPYTNPDMLKFGNSENSGEDFSGTLDEVRIWSAARSSTDIRCGRRQTLVGNETGLEGYWDFNEGGGQIANDKSSTQNDGTLGISSSGEPQDAVWFQAAIPGFGLACDLTSPTASILFAAHGSSPTISSLTSLSGTAQDNWQIADMGLILRRESDGYYWSRNGSFWSPSQVINMVDGTHAWSLPATNIPWFANAYYNLELSVIDADGNMGQVQSRFYVMADSESTPPTLGFIYPVNNSVYNPNQMTNINGTAQDNIGLQSIKLKITRNSDGYTWNGSSVIWTSGTSWNYSSGLTAWYNTIPISAWNGSTVAVTYSLVAEAKDLSNNTAQQTVTITVQPETTGGGGPGDLVPPTGSISHPVNGSTHAPSALYSIYGTASDPNLMTVSATLLYQTTGKYWNGATFNSSSPYYLIPISLTAWNISGFTGASWQNGVYILTVTAKDQNLNTTVIASTFTVNSGLNGDSTPPTVQINSPTNGGIFNPQSIAINGQANDSNALQWVRIKLKNNSTNLYFDGSSFLSAAPVELQADGLSYWSRYVPTIAFANGNYTLTAIASDLANNLSNPHEITFTVSGASSSADGVSPTVHLAFPVDNATYTNAYDLTNLYGTASDNVAIYSTDLSLVDDQGKYWNGWAWESTSEIFHVAYGTSSQWSYNLPVGAWKNGYFTLRVRTRDTSNNSTSLIIHFTVSGLVGTGSADTQNPVNLIYNPVANSTGSPYTFTYLNGQAQDSFGIQDVVISLERLSDNLFWTSNAFSASVETWIAPTLTANGNSKNWSYSVPFSAYANGQYRLRVRSKDPANNTQTDAVLFTVTGAAQADLTAPTLAFTQLVNAQSYSSQDLLTKIVGTAQDDLRVDRVEVKIVDSTLNQNWNGYSWTSTGEFWLLAVGTQSWTWSNFVGMWTAGRSYNVYAKAVDGVGHQTVVVASITVSGAGGALTPPTVAILSPTHLQTYSLTTVQLSGTASATAATVTQVGIKIQDKNTNEYWNSTSLFWQGIEYVNTASITVSGQWSALFPIYWRSGQYRISALAQDSNGLLSMPQTVDIQISNTGSGGGDVTPPASIANLAATPGTTPGSITLSWTDTGDDGSTGTAQTLTIKTSQAPISSDADWTTAVSIEGPPFYASVTTPSASGTVRSKTINNLVQGVVYFFAMRAIDEAGNRSTLSNSASAIALAANTTTAHDGEGSMSLSPSTVQENVQQTLTFTFTVGSGGLSQGAQVAINFPSQFSFPQTHTSGMFGYVTATSSKNTVALSVTTSGNSTNIGLTSGSLSSGDKITITYLGYAYCGVNANLVVQVLTRSGSNGQLTPISTQPTLSVTAGPATRFGFDSYEKLVQVGYITPMTVYALNNCGSRTNLTSNIQIDASAVRWDNTNYVYVSNANAEIALDSNFTSPSQSNTFTMTSGSGQSTLYYRQNTFGQTDTKLRLRYPDFLNSNYTQETQLDIRSSSVSVSLSNVSIDEGTQGTLTTLTTQITPGKNIFINFTVPVDNTSSQVLIKRNGTLVKTLWGYGRVLRLSWNLLNETYQPAVAGSYTVEIKAAGLTNTDLTFVLQGNGLSGRVVNAINNQPVPYANLNFFGATTFRSVPADATGYYSISGLPQGTYTLRVEKEGYRPTETSVTLTAGEQTHNVSLVPYSKVVIDFARPQASVLPEVWGMIEARSDSQYFSLPVRFGLGRLDADNGAVGIDPEFQLAPGVSFTLTARLQGYTVDPISVNLTQGQTQTWTAVLTSEKRIAGTIRLENGVVNSSGVYVQVVGGKDTNGDYQFDLGYPTLFASVYLPPGDNQAAYALPGVPTGSYAVMAHAPGFQSAKSLVTVGASDASLDLLLTQGGQLSLTFNVSGNTTLLDSNDGISNNLFPITIDYVGSDGARGEKTYSVATHLTQTIQSFTLQGVPNGTHSLSVRKINGFKLVPEGARSVTVANGVGSVTFILNQASGEIEGTVTPASGSSISNVKMILYLNGKVVSSTPTLTGNFYEFSRLETGLYELFVYDTQLSASLRLTVPVTDGVVTTQNVTFDSGTYYAVTGVVRTEAPGDYSTLSSIDTNSTDTTIYTHSGTQQISALRVEAYLLDNGTIKNFPTTAEKTLVPGTIGWAEVNPANGTFTFSKLRAGVPYLFKLNNDFDNDGIDDVASAVDGTDGDLQTLTASKTLNFVYKSGSNIEVTLIASASDTGHELTARLFNMDLGGRLVSEKIGTLNETSLSLSFANLSKGRYKVEIQDAEGEYSAVPAYFSLINPSETKSAQISLKKSINVRFKLSFNNVLITDLDSLPTATEIILKSNGVTLLATGPSQDGTFTVSDVLPNVAYTLFVKPPLDLDAAEATKSFMPLTKTVQSTNDLDLGVFVLDPANLFTIAVTDDEGVALPNVLIQIHQSLERHLAPMKIMSDSNGTAKFPIDTRVRFYDIGVNLPGEVETQKDYAFTELKMQDTNLLNSVTVTLQGITSSLNMVVSPASGKSLKTNIKGKNLSGATVEIYRKGQISRWLESFTNADGGFTLPLPPGVYRLVVRAEDHKNLEKEFTLDSDVDLDLGTLVLGGGLTLKGDVFDVYGDPADVKYVSKILARSAANENFYADLISDEDTGRVFGYVLTGLSAGTYDLYQVDETGRVTALKTITLDKNTTADLEIAITVPELTARLIEKKPDGVNILFSSTHEFDSTQDDLDNNGTADTEEFNEFVTVTTPSNGQSNLEFDDVDAQRKTASYTYTWNDANAKKLEVTGQFTTNQIDRETGEKFTVTTQASFHRGLLGLQKQIVQKETGAQFDLQTGSSLILQADTLRTLNGTGINSEISFQAADTIGDIEASVGASTLSAGQKAISLANALGASAYPSRMYKAIKALESSPTVEPFSSFYDIFLPAGVSHFLNRPGTICLTYDLGANPADINIYYFNEAQSVYTIENTNRVVDTSARRICADIRHASIFTVLSASAPIIQGDGFSGELEVFNFPNPFDLNTKTVTLQHPGSSSASQSIHGTMLKISIPTNLSGSAEIKIYNIAGELVRTINSSGLTSGAHNYLEWDGLNDHGNQVASGVYIGRLSIGSEERLFKMAVIK